MAKYVLLYTGGGGMASTPEEQAASMQRWTNWFGGLGSAVADAGNPFMPMAKTVNPDGSVEAGPAGTMISGYTILAADSMDAAVEMARNCPQVVEGGQVTVYEILPVM